MKIHSKSRLLRLLPYTLKQQILGGLRAFGQLTARARLEPGFLLIGAQRSGTSSLYAGLIRHSQVAGALRKEIHFFDLHYSRGTAWYRGHFPWIRPKPGGLRAITGEASPYYLFYPHASGRVHRQYPGIRLIVLLRNPIDRAYSHYQHELQQGVETCSFEEALSLEDERLRGEVDRIRNDESYISFAHQHFSYRSRGLYLEQLQCWRRWFSPDQILILQSEAFFARQAEAYRQVLAFLELPDWAPGEIAHENRRAYPPMPASLRSCLSEFFEPHNQALYTYLGQDFGWK